MRTVQAKEFASEWSAPEVVQFRKDVGDALAPIGSKTKQVYSDVMSLFTASVTNFIEGTTPDTANPEAKFSASPTGQDIANIGKSAKDFNDGMKKQVNQMMFDIDYGVSEASDGLDRIKASIGANIAVGIIEEIATDISAIAENETKKTIDAGKKFFKKSLDRAAKAYEEDALIPPEVKKKMLQSMKDIDANFHADRKRGEGVDAFMYDLRKRKEQLSQAINKALNSKKYQETEKREQLRQEMLKAVNDIDRGFSVKKINEDIRRERITRIQGNIVKLLRETFKDSPISLEVQQEAIKSVQKSAKEIAAKSQKAYHESMDKLKTKSLDINSIDNIKL